MKRTVSISPAQWRALGSGADPVSQDVVIAIDGSLSVDRLEEALALMIGRHEPLRTCYPVGDDDVLVQEIWDEFHPALARLDLTTATSEEERLGALVDWLDRSTFTYDEARNAPPIRLAMAKLSEVEHVLLMRTVYATFDLIGMRTWFEELFQAYSAPTSLPPIVKPFSEFCEAYVEEDRLEHWRNVLAPFRGDAGPVEDAPIHCWNWQGETLAKVQTAARGLRVSSFAFHVAALAAVCARHGMRNVLVMADSANRPEEATRLVGHFADVTFIPVEWDDDDSVADLVRRAHDALMSALESVVPYYAIVAELPAFAPSAHLSDALSTAPPFRRPLFTPRLEEIIRGHCLAYASGGGVRGAMVRLPRTTRSADVLTVDLFGGEMQRGCVAWPGHCAADVRAAADLYQRVLAAPTTVQASDLLR